MNRMILACSCLVFLAACNDSNHGDHTAQATPSAASATPAQPVAQQQPASAAEAPPPTHNYVYIQDGTYGYEPALSEDDVRSGKATKALVMMRYVGLRNGTYILILLNDNDSSVTNRVTCQAPCNFAKSETITGDTVLRTETIRVVPNSLVGAMLEDAMSGQLAPYGQAPSMPQYKPAGTATTQAPPTMPAIAPAPPVNPGRQPDQAQSQGAASMEGGLQQTSFDCGKAKSIPEYLICHDPDLATADRDLAAVYQQAKDAVSDKTAFAERTRKQWNFREKNCHDKECLVSWYGYQKRVLTKIAQTGDVTAQDN